MFTPDTLCRVKLDPMDPLCKAQMMKRLDEVEIHLDWALSVNLNWALILCVNKAEYCGQLVRMRYDGGMLALNMDPSQRLAVPNPKGGYTWVSAGDLRVGYELWFLPTDISKPNPFRPARITSLEYPFYDGTLWSMTTLEEMTFVPLDVLAHRNPKDFKANKNILMSEFARG